MQDVTSSILGQLIFSIVVVLYMFVSVFEVFYHTGSLSLMLVTIVVNMLIYKEILRITNRSGPRK